MCHSCWFCVQIIRSSFGFRYKLYLVHDVRVFHLLIYDDSLLLSKFGVFVDVPIDNSSREANLTITRKKPKLPFVMAKKMKSRGRGGREGEDRKGRGMNRWSRI